MTPNDTLHLSCEGAVVTVLFRWLLRLDVELPTAALVGAVGRLLGAWPSLGTGTGPLESLPTVLIGAMIALALLGVSQVFRAR